MLARLSTVSRRPAAACARAFSADASEASMAAFDLFNPTDEHRALRESVRAFAESEVRPQALKFNREEKFNRELFNKCGDLGLLGVTVCVHISWMIIDRCFGQSGD